MLPDKYLIDSGQRIIFALLMATLIDVFLRKISNKSFPESRTMLTISYSRGMLFGRIAQQMGVHGLFGFFLACVVAG